MGEMNTKRLTLRPVVDTDLDAIAWMMTDPEVCRYIGDGTPRTRDRVAQSVSFARRMWADRGFGPFTIELAEADSAPRPPDLENARFVGVCLLLPIARSGTDPRDFAQRGPEIEIGYWLARDEWGLGYATEASGAVLGWARSAEGPALERVIAVTNPAHKASQRVLEKIGMSKVGMTDAYYDAETILYEIGSPGQG